MVFQSYALFPHYNVFDNIAYGLKIKTSRTRNKKQGFKNLGNHRLAGDGKTISNQLSEVSNSA